MTHIPVPKYHIGQKVFAASVILMSTEVPCKDCLGTKVWPLTTPAGEDTEIECPTCRIDRQYVPCHLGRTQVLTIGSVRIDTNDDPPVHYMCEETGVGSGTLWREYALHVDEAGAQADADVEAKRRDLEVLKRQAERRLAERKRVRRKKAK